MRICAQCQLDLGVPKDPSHSHGLCRRHTRLWLESAKLSPTALAGILRRLDSADPSAFPPDLRARPAWMRAMGDNEPAHPIERNYGLPRG